MLNIDSDIDFAAIEQRFLRPNQAAARIGTSPTYLCNLRCYGLGPRYHKIAGRVLYDARDLDEWNAQRGAAKRRSA